MQNILTRLLYIHTYICKCLLYYKLNLNSQDILCNSSLVSDVDIGSHIHKNQKVVSNRRCYEEDEIYEMILDKNWEILFL